MNAVHQHSGCGPQHPHVNSARAQPQHVGSTAGQRRRGPPADPEQRSQLHQQSFFIINPNFESYFNFSFTQPLWRGFRETQTERQLKLYNLDRRINESQFEERVSDIVLRLQNEYWELVSAIDNHETRRQSREQAVLQHELTSAG